MPRSRKPPTTSPACLGDDRDPEPIAALFLIPSSLKTGEIARILREGYDVGLLNDGFRRPGRSAEARLSVHRHASRRQRRDAAVDRHFRHAVLIVRPDNQDFQGTAVTVELARRLEVPEMLMVVNKVPPGMTTRTLLRAAGRDMYQAEVVGMLPLNTEMVRLASGGIFADSLSRPSVHARRLQRNRRPHPV